MSSEQNVKSRILWIDIFKGIVIVLVVIGHATGLWNNYIYQFHVAAFFFISGYVSNLENKKLSSVVINKFFTIYMPLIFFVIVGSIFLVICNRLGIGKVLFGDGYLGFWPTLKNFFMTGNINIQFLGACWFLITLLEVFLIEKILISLCGNLRSKRDIILFFLMSSVIYVIGYYINLKIFIVAMIFAIGKILSRLKMNILSKVPIQMVGLLINGILFYYFANKLHLVVDLASSSVNSPLLDIIMQMNGIWFIYNISKLIERFLQNITTILSYIGKNTLGILVGHFAVFKMCFCAMVLLGIMPIQDLSSITPSTGIGNKYWWLFTITALILCLIAWELLKKVSDIRFLIGEDRLAYKTIESNIMNNERIHNVDNFIKEIYIKYVDVKWERYVLFILCVCFMIYAGNVKYQNLNMEYIEINDMREPNDAVVFGEGWYETNSNEEYRWINDKASMLVNGKFRNELVLSIYVPDNFEEVNIVDIYIQNELLDSVDFSEERGQTLTYDISNYEISDKEYKVEIDFNGVHVPTEDSEDQRYLSGMVSYVCVK